MEKTYSAMRAARYAVAQPAGVRNDSGENKDRSEARDDEKQQTDQIVDTGSVITCLLYTSIFFHNSNGFLALNGVPNVFCRKDILDNFILDNAASGFFIGKFCQPYMLSLIHI